MPQQKLKEQLIKQKIIKKKDKFTVLRADWRYPADVYVNGQKIGSADYNGREYFFKAFKKLKKNKVTNPLTFKDVVRGKK